MSLGELAHSFVNLRLSICDVNWTPSTVCNGQPVDKACAGRHNRKQSHTLSAACVKSVRTSGQARPAIEMAHCPRRPTLLSCRCTSCVEEPAIGLLMVCCVRGVYASSAAVPPCAISCNLLGRACRGDAVADAGWP